MSDFKPLSRPLPMTFFRTIGVSNVDIPTRDEQEALWELAQLDRANGAVRDKLLNRWFGTTETDGGQGMPPAVALLAVVDAFMRGGGWWQAGPPGSHGVEMWNTIDLPSAERWN